MSKLFGGKDPFFGYPFDDDKQAAPKTEISMQEMDTQNHSVPAKEEVLNYPNDNSYGAPSFSFKRVSYGGINGMYYSSSMGTRTGGDGVVLIEIKEEDKTVGQALSTISKGINDKGHSVTTKHNPDGTVNSIQTLHNLYEDELAGFEETWKVNADQHLPGWNNGFNFLENSGPTSGGWDQLAAWGGFALPSAEHWGNGGSMESDGDSQVVSSSGRSKKLVPVNIE